MYNTKINSQKNFRRSAAHSILQKKDVENHSEPFIDNRHKSIFPIFQLQRKVSDKTMATLLPSAKKYISNIVQQKLGKPSDNPSELDHMSEQLNTFSNPNSRNCSSMLMLDDDEMLLGFNQNKVKDSQQYFGGGGGGGEEEKEQDKPKPDSYFDGVKLQNVNDSKATKHAEMKLLDFIYKKSLQDGESMPKYGPIGISQPCCMLCAMVMILLGQEKSIRGYHKKSVTNWSIPDVIRNSSELSKLFVGSDVAGKLGTEQDDWDRFFLMIGSNSNGW